MADIAVVVPSVLNGGGGEKRLKVSANTAGEALAGAAVQMGDDFKRRVLEPDGSPRALINVYVNGKNADFAGGMGAALSDGDELYVLPAVAGGSGLSEAELDRFSRQVMLEEIGYSGQLKLRDARVCVVGAGGLGNPIAVRLAAMGLGTLRLVDRDVIETSNLHRQTLFDDDDVGQVKVEAAARKLAKTGPSCKIEALAVSVNEYTAAEVVSGCDVVVDALDSVNARYALNRACVEAKIPFVTGAAVGVSGQAFTVVPGESACYHCVFPSLDEDSMPTCSIEGVHPSILSVVGGVEVSEAVRIILGQQPALSGRMLHVNLSTMDFEKIRTFRATECPVCGSGSRTAEPREQLLVEELCGRGRGKRTFSITPTSPLELDSGAVAAAGRGRGLEAEDLGKLGMSLRNRDYSVSIMNRGSAVIVGARDEGEAVSMYRSLLGVPS